MAKKWSKRLKSKNKTIVFYETFKVQTIKVVLFFSFEVIWTIFWHFSGFKAKNQEIVKKLSKQSEIQKIKPLYFMKLSKFKL